MLATAALALLLLPWVWMTRERDEILRARNQALRAVVLAERHRSQLKEREVAPLAQPGPGESSSVEDSPSPGPSVDPALIDRLQRENAELKATIEQLRREIERLEATARGPS
jgi:hypothetical protein